MPIKFENVNFSYQSNSPLAEQALFDINLAIGDHEFIALIGQTGSGKSTLVQHLNALLLPQSGKLTIGDRKIDFDEKKKKRIKNLKEFRKYSGLVFQFPEYQLFESDVLKDVAFGPKNFGTSNEESVEIAKQALNLVGIDESFWNRSPFELSGGQKRRVAIAGIIALNPKFLVLDEPTAGLDPQGTIEMMELFKKIYDSGTTVILVTHDMDLVLKYASRAVVMNKGKIIEDGTPLQIFQDKDTLEDLSIAYPKVFSMAYELIKMGLPLLLENIKDIDSLAQEIMRVRGK